MNEVTNDNAILETYQTIKEILTQARSEAYRAVNFAVVQAYWNIGMIIVPAAKGSENGYIFGRIKRY